MTTNVEILLAIWVVVGVFSLYVGATNLRHPDAAWERAAENLKRRGLVAKRTARWERSRVFSGALTLLIGATLLAMAGWVGITRSQGSPAQTITFSDPTTGQPITRTLTAGESEELKRDPAKFMETITPTGAQAGSRR